MEVSPGFLVFAFLLCVIANSLSFSTTNGASMNPHQRGGGSTLRNDEPTVVQMEYAPPGVVWVVQMSDIHISKWTPARGRALRKSLGHALKVIKPAIVLVTGDLTDAKTKDMRTTLQQEVEWIEYRQSFLKIADDSGIPLQNFFDLRGNHDKYGVPLQSPLDYHPKYSISAAMNRSSLVQSVTVQGRDGRKNLFVGFDDAMRVGLRGPSNLFGHPTDEVLVQLDQKLRSWDDNNPVTKIVYGHFPMSFTTSSETGKRVEDVMASNNVTAYVCGHLHTSFGRHLYKHHKKHTGDFWEWEMGDWRISRMMRVMAIDHGHTSFVDVELIPPTDTAEGEFTMPTVILQTYPLDSRFMLPTSEKGAEVSNATLNSIRALVFSETTPSWVKATIYDITSHPPKLVNVTFMKETSANGTEGVFHGAHYYTTSWDRERYIYNSGLKYAMQIVAKSSNENVTYSEMRFISASGEPSKFHPKVMVFLVLGVKWEKVFPVALWSTITLLLSVLVASKLFLWRLEKNGKYEEWMTSVFRPSSTLSGALGKIFKVPFGGLVELCSRNFLVWLGIVLYVLYLTFFPWFSGRILAEDYPIGYMSLHGWTVKPSNVKSVQTVSGLGVPDIIVIVMAYLYGVLVPLLLVVSILSAERAAFEFHKQTLGKCLKTNKKSIVSSPQESVVSSSEVMMDQGAAGDDQVDESDSLISKTKDGSSDPRRHFFSGKTRKGLFVGCLVIAFILLQLCLLIGRSYGFSALATAPVYAWSVPVLLVLSFHQTLRISCRCTGCLKP